MRQISYVLGLSLCLLALPTFVLSQKGQLKESNDAGKEEIKGNDNPKSSYSGNSESNSSYQPAETYTPPPPVYVPEPVYTPEPEPAPYVQPAESNNSNSNSGSSNWASPSESSSDWSRPEPIQPKPTTQGRPTSGKPNTGSHSASTNFSDSPGNATATETLDGRTVLFDAPGPKTTRGEGKLPGVRPDPLPLPPVNGNAPLGQAGNGGIFDEPRPDTIRPIHWGGTVLSAPPRPYFSRDTLPNKPTLSQLGNAPKPTPSPGPTASPQYDPYGEYYDFQGNFGGEEEGGFIGYATDNMPYELACIYQTADQLERLYLQPSWCQADFDGSYRMLLTNFDQCYRALPGGLHEDWMWPAFLTFEDEMRFWAEECASNNPELREIRDFLRAKAAFVPYLMPEVDAKSVEDWTYIDTAFAAPFGGYNYYHTVQAYQPELVLRQVRSWLGRFNIEVWPSYERVARFHDGYFRSGFWALLRNKVMQDFANAKIVMQLDENAGYHLAENAGWLCAAMLAIEPKEREMTDLRDQVRTLLRSRPGRWTDHPLAKVLD